MSVCKLDWWYFVSLIDFILTCLDTTCNFLIKNNQIISLFLLAISIMLNLIFAQSKLPLLCIITIINNCHRQETRMIMIGDFKQLIEIIHLLLLLYIRTVAILIKDRVLLNMDKVKIFCENLLNCLIKTYSFGWIFS